MATFRKVLITDRQARKGFRTHARRGGRTGWGSLPQTGIVSGLIQNTCFSGHSFDQSARLDGKGRKRTQKTGPKSGSQWQVFRGSFTATSSLGAHVARLQAALLSGVTSDERGRPSQPPAPRKWQTAIFENAARSDACTIATKRAETRDRLVHSPRTTRVRLLLKPRHRTVSAVRNFSDEPAIRRSHEDSEDCSLWTCAIFAIFVQPSWLTPRQPMPP